MSEFDQALLEAAVKIIIAVAVPVLTVVVVQLIQAGRGFLRSKLSVQQLVVADTLIDLFVKAAEQYNLSELAARSGAEKKAWVVSRANEELERIGIHFDTIALADLVEAKIKEGVKTGPVLISSYAIGDQEHADD